MSTEKEFRDAETRITGKRFCRNCQRDRPVFKGRYCNLCTAKNTEFKRKRAQELNNAQS